MSGRPGSAARGRLRSLSTVISRTSVALPGLSARAATMRPWATGSSRSTDAVARRRERRPRVVANVLDERPLGRTPLPAAAGPLKPPIRCYQRTVALSRHPVVAGTDAEPLRAASTPKRSASTNVLDIVGSNTFATSPVTGRLLRVEGGHLPCALHELALRVRQIEAEEDAVADNPAPRDEEVAHVAGGRTGEHDVDLFLLRSQEVLGHRGVVEHHNVGLGAGNDFTVVVAAVDATEAVAAEKSKVVCVGGVFRSGPNRVYW